MNRLLRILAGLAILVMVLSAAGCNKLMARDQLNKGVKSYKNGRYEEAIAHFQEAVERDPALLNARLYLATAYAQQVTPGADTPENTRYANSAIEEYKTVITEDPKNSGAIKGIAYLYLQQKNWEEAKKYYKMAVEVDPNDPETYYSVAVIDWTQSYVPRIQKRSLITDLKPNEPLRPKKDQKLCDELKAGNSAHVEEGMQLLQTALQLRPDYDDAMAYLNLLYRERADYTCDDPAARAADLKTADDWTDKTLAIKKAKAEKQQGPGGITLDQPQGK